MKKTTSRVQVQKEHYFNSGYDNIFRFLSYQHQIELVRKLNPKTVLEIGVGNGAFANYLKQAGIKVTTCDIDKKLNPDVVGDILNLPFENKTFDVVVAFEVLEHLPFEKFEKALSELNKVSRKNSVISLPYPCIPFTLAVKFPLINKLIKNPIPNTSLRIPKFWQSNKFDGEHYWEIGKKGSSLREIRSILKKQFKITKENHPLMNPYHEFFVLEK